MGIVRGGKNVRCGGTTCAPHAFIRKRRSKECRLTRSCANLVGTPCGPCADLVRIRFGAYVCARHALFFLERVRQGEKIDAGTLKQMYAYMSTGSRVRRGFKQLNHLQIHDMFSFEELRDQMGLLAEQTMPWDEALNRLPLMDRTYISAALRRGERLDQEARVKVSTIHGAKGGEADNVALFTDLSAASDRSRLTLDEEGLKQQDDLHRLFYVGVTRTKQNLFLVEPEDALRSYTI